MYAVSNGIKTNKV